MEYRDSLRLEAVEEKQDLEKLTRLFEQFKNYIEALRKFLKGELASQEFAAQHEAFRLRMEEEQHRFFEWHDGDQVWNDAIHVLIYQPDTLDPNAFQYAVIAATAKFQHLLEKGKDQLLDVHERLAALTDNADAERITHLDLQDRKKTLSEKVKVADTNLETVFKWGNRVVEIGSWLMRLFS